MSRNTTVTKSSSQGFNFGAYQKLALQFCLIFAIALAFLIAPMAATPAFAGEDIIYTVKPGESLSSIAGRYGVNMYTLANYNGIGNVNMLREGQVLRIPTGTEPRPVYPTPTREAPGTISQPPRARVKTPAPYIVEPNYPRPTTTPVVATPVPPVFKERVHIVATFDTLTSIANLYGSSVSRIQARNGIGERIYAGQRLIIP